MSAGRRSFELPPNRLTAREREILAHIGRGEDDATIAASLGISRGGVGVHKQRIREKLELPSTRHLAMYAVEKGLTVYGGPE